MARKIRVGIAGCGKIAQVGHIPGLQAVPGVQVAALCDTDRKRVESVQADLAPEAGIYTEYKAMIAADLDAVAVCTPNDLHAPMTVAALKRGLHVLCEKPIAGTLADASRMIREARKADRVLHINQSLRYAPLYQAAVDLVRRGRIGEPRHVRCMRASGKTPDKGWSPGASWFVSKEHQGGLVLDIGVHMADLMKWMFGDVAAVSAVLETRRPDIDVSDHVGALFRFSNGATGVLEMSWALPVGGAFLEVYGSRGRLRIGDGEKPIELVQAGGKAPRTSYPPVRKSARSSYACFIDAVRGRRPSPTSGELGRDALALCEAMVRSDAQGRFVRVKTYGKEA